MRTGEINKMVNLLKGLDDERLINGWLKMVNDMDDAVLSRQLSAELGQLATTKSILDLRQLVGNDTVTAVFLYHFKGKTKEFGEFTRKLLAMGEQRSKFVIDLLFNKGYSVSPATLMSIIERNSSLEQSVLFGLERLGRGAKGIKADVDQMLKTVPNDKLDDFLISVGLLAEQELTQLLRLYAKKDKALLDYLAKNSDDLSKMKDVLALPAKPGTGRVTPPPPPLPKSIASNKSFQQTGKQKSGLVAGKLRQLPNRTIFVAPQATSESEAMKMFYQAYKDHPIREAAIYRNTETGEFIIVQGEKDAVSMAPGDAGFTKSVKEVLNHDLGDWQLYAHSHPIDKKTGEVLLADRYPSGASGDFGMLIYESAKAGKVARTSSIFYFTKDGLEQTIFSFNPKARFKRYEIDIPEPVPVNASPNRLCR